MLAAIANEALSRSWWFDSSLPQDPVVEETLMLFLKYSCRKGC